MAKFTLGVTLKAVDEMTGPLKKVTGDVKKLDRAIKSLDGRRAFAGFTQSVGRLQASVAQAAGHFTALGVTAGAAMAAILKPAMELDDLRFQMDNLLGSTEKGAKAFARLTKLGKETPYTLGTVVDFFNQVQAADPTNKGLVENFDGLINVLGRTQPSAVKAQSAIMGLTQAFSVGKLQLQDFKQIMNGLPSIKPIIEDITGFKDEALYQAFSDGVIDQSAIIKIVKAMSGLKSVGNVSDLLSVKLSNLGDIFALTAYKLMNTKVGNLSFADTLKKDLDALLTLLDGGLSTDQLTAIAATLSDVYSAGKDVIVDVVIPAAILAKNLFDVLNSITGGPGNSMKLLLLAIAVPTVIAALATIVGLVSTLVALPGMIAATVGGITAALGVLTTLGSSVASIGGIFSAIGAVIGSVLGAIFTPAALVTAAVLAIGLAAFKVVQYWDKAKSPLQNILNGIKMAFVDLWKVIKPILQAIPLVNQIPGLARTPAKPPGRAAGGPVTGGMPYTVGERGPELFLPGQSGSIVPNHLLGRGGGGQQSIHIQIDVAGKAHIVGTKSKGKPVPMTLNMGYTR